MIPGAPLDNLTSWLIQVFLVASVGALLPLLLRIRHPRSQLVYCHSVLLLCFALPVIQPLQESLIVATARVSDVQPAQNPQVAWGTVVLWLLVAGILARLCWLGAGLRQLTRYRNSAIPIRPTPDSIREACRLTGADATFCVSSAVDGPSTMGWIDPVVLLPVSFLSLDRDAQRGIACHELLHVRRRDWLITILEEFAGAFFWFNPGVWWLLAQARLNREQLVDAEVVRLTAREPYIQALLSMAVVPRRRWTLPAASFFTQGHLIRRMRLLLADGRGSVLRLCVSYTVMGCLLAAVMCGIFVWLPLGHETQIVWASPPARLLHLPIRGEVPPPVARKNPATEFNIQLPPPEGHVEDVQYFVQGTAPDTGGPREDFFLMAPPPPPPPPPPPMPGPFGFLMQRGLRMVRPGEIASPEQIQQLRDALGERAVLEIQQAEDGTVRRITVQARRFSDEANSIRTSVPFAATEPAAPADGID